jgi:hypothetical protein
MAPLAFADGTRVRTTDDMIAFWVECASTRMTDPPSDERSSIIMRGDRLYHYGTHFCLAQVIRTKAGTPKLILLNGDRYAGSGGWGTGTGARQFEVRNAVRRTNVPNVTIPFSALDAAGITRDSIELLDEVADRWTTTYWTGVPRRGSYYGDMLAQHGHITVYRQSSSTGEVIEPNEDGTVTIPQDRHWLGEALIRATARVDTERPATKEEIASYKRWCAYRYRLRCLEVRRKDIEVELHGAYHAVAYLYPSPYGGRFTYDSTRVPPNVEAEIEEIRTRLRQAQDAYSEANYTRNAPDSHNIRKRGGKYTIPITVDKRSKYLSAFDHNEAREVYFLCELPRTSASTVDEAFEALKPNEVIDAERAGLTPQRQGDIFAIPTAYTTKELKSRGELVKRPHVLGTNHTATEVVVTAEGTYARGTLRHEPGGWRDADHARQRIGDGKQWHRLVKNTVPGAGGSSGNMTARQSGQSRAWTMGGQVD